MVNSAKRQRLRLTMVQVEWMGSKRPATEAFLVVLAMLAMPALYSDDLDDLFAKMAAYNSDYIESFESDLDGDGAIELWVNLNQDRYEDADLWSVFEQAPSGFELRPAGAAEMKDTSNELYSEVRNGIHYIVSTRFKIEAMTIRSNILAVEDWGQASDGDQALPGGQNLPGLKIETRKIEKAAFAEQYLDPATKPLFERPENYTQEEQLLPELQQIFKEKERLAKQVMEMLDSGLYRRKDPGKPFVMGPEDLELIEQGAAPKGAEGRGADLSHQPLLESFTNEDSSASIGSEEPSAKR